MRAERRSRRVGAFLHQHISREAVAGGIQSARKALSKISRGTALEISAVVIILFITVAVRIMPIRWGWYINEFDPYLQWRMIQYVVDHGFLSWFRWHDTMSWYPYGADMATWNLYGEAFVVAALTIFLRWIHVTVSTLDMVMIFPVAAGTATVLAAYFFGRDLWGRGAGLLTALFLGLNASSIGRTSLGFLRHEPLGILLMILIFLFFRRANIQSASIRKTLAYSVLAGFSLFYLAGSWAAFYYPLDVLVLYSLVLALLGRSSKKLLVSYSLTMGVFLLLTPFLVPKLGFHALEGSAFLAVPFGEIILLAREAPSYIPSIRMRVLVFLGAAATVIGAITSLAYLGAIQSLSGKFGVVIDPLVRAAAPIIQSVAEQQPATWSSFFYEFGAITFLMLLGFVLVLRRGRNDDIFLVLWGITSVYFAASFVRLTLLLAPAFSILAAVGTVELSKPAVDIIREAVIYPVRKTRVIARLGREFGVAIFLILLIATLPTFWNTVQGAYQPATIVTSSIPVLPHAGQELHYQDWLEAVSWTRLNTPPRSVIFAWWDYGYWITALGNRTTLADNGTQNSTQIGMIAQSFMDNTTMAIPTLQRYNVSYIAFFITPSSSGAGTSYQGFGEDGKWYWMTRIGNNTKWNGYRIVFKETPPTTQNQRPGYYRMIMNTTSHRILSNTTIAQNGQLNSDSLLGYLMSVATLSGTRTQSPYLRQVFSSSNRYVFLFNVRYLIATIITLNSITHQVTYGAKVILSGKLTNSKGIPLSRGPLAVDLQYSTSNGVTWTELQKVPVSAQGVFNYTWNPNPGTYLVRSQYVGFESVYAGSTSTPQSLTISKLNATLKLTASTVNVKVGDSVTFHLSMQPYVNGANVTLLYSLNDKPYTKIKSFLISSDSVDVNWTVNVSGALKVVAQWQGSVNYASSSSQPITIQSGS